MKNSNVVPIRRATPRSELLTCPCGGQWFTAAVALDLDCRVVARALDLVCRDCDATLRA